MEHVWSVLCTMAITDVQRNNLTLVNTIEQLNVPANLEAEAIGANLTLASMWWRSDLDVPEIASIQYLIRSPNEEILFQSPILELDMTEYKRVRASHEFTPIPFKGFGVYRFIIEKLTETDGWQLVASVPFEIVAKDDDAVDGAN